MQLQPVRQGRIKQCTAVHSSDSSLRVKHHVGLSGSELACEAMGKALRSACACHSRLTCADNSPHDVGHAPRLPKASPGWSCRSASKPWRLIYTELGSKQRLLASYCWQPSKTHGPRMFDWTSDPSLLRTAKPQLKRIWDPSQAANQSSLVETAVPALHSSCLWHQRDNHATLPAGCSCPQLGLKTQLISG